MVTPEICGFFEPSRSSFTPMKPLKMPSLGNIWLGTLTNIVATGGEASANQTFSCTIEFNGKPRTVNGQLTLTENADQLWTYKAAIDTSAKPSTSTEPATPQPEKPQPIVPVKVVSANDADDTDKKTNQDSGKTPGVAAGGTGTVKPTV